jgi:hypothetical protein
MADFKRIDNWIRKNRPDIVPQWEVVQNNNGVILLMAIGYEAGLEAGKENA